MSECNRSEPDPIARENSSKSKDGKVESEEFDHDWVTVTSKKMQLMDKEARQDCIQNQKMIMENKKKKKTRSINGVLLESGVT